MPIVRRRCRSRGQDIALHRDGEALVLVGFGHVVSGPLHLLRGVAHGDAVSGTFEHEHVVRHVSDRGDLCGFNAVALREVRHHPALVGIGMRDVGVVRLRARRRDMVTEAVVDRLDGRLYRVEVVADPYDFCDPVGDGREVIDWRRVELDRPGLTVHVRSLRVADEPVRTSVDPYVDTVVVQHVDHLGRDIIRYRSLFDHRHVRIGEEPTVERRDGRAQSKRIHEHRHTAWGSPTRHGEKDPRLAELPHRGDGPVGQDLVLGDQGPVDIGEQQPNGVSFRHQPFSPSFREVLVPAARRPTLTCFLRATGFRGTPARAHLARSSPPGGWRSGAVVISSLPVSTSPGCPCVLPSDDSAIGR